VSSPTSSNIEKNINSLGDPDCPFCKGLGFLREDLPIDHPMFGKIEICTCRQSVVSQEIRQRLFFLSNLEQLKHLTFENFNPNGRTGLFPRQAASLHSALEQSVRFGQLLNGWMIIQGGYGCGKTHLSAAIANFAANLGVHTLFITVPDLLDTLRYSYNSEDTTFEERFEEIRSVPLLILDDFGTQNATEWSQEKLFQIINFRYINHLPLVITTNLNLKDIEGRIRSRLDDPELVQKVVIEAPDYRNPVIDMGYHELSALNQLHGKTFFDFSLRNDENLANEELQSIKKALQLAEEYAKEPRGWLILMGSYGSGKTHLAAAIANYRENLGQKQLFIIVPELIDHLRSTFSPTSQVTFDRVFDDVKVAPFLILDDLSTQSITPWVREKLQQLFNFRYNRELPTVITTADTLENMDERIRSRLLDRRLCKIFAITSTPYTGGGRSASTTRKPQPRKRT